MGINKNKYVHKSTFSGLRPDGWIISFQG